MYLAQQSASLAQEPFTYRPKDIPKQDIPEGHTAEEYINNVYRENHYRIKVTFKVIDEQGLPVKEADMNVGIDSLLHADGFNNYKGKTNDDGLYTVESRGRGCSEIVVTKKGYYPSRPDVTWDGKLNPGGGITHKNGGFRPWNPTVKVVLKKIGKPIPMKVWLIGSHSLPKTGKECGFDLFEKDWVKPYGKGETSDLLIKFDTDFKSPNNYKTSYSIRFSNPKDGFIPIPELINTESLLKYPRVAPVNGYTTKEINLTKEAGKGGARLFAKKKEPMGYIVRFRTLKDPETNKILSAYYGKITAPKEYVANVNPFEIYAYMWKNRKIDLTSRFRFSFYLNPTVNDRNLEYDQINNLAPNAPKGVQWLP